MKTAFAVWNNRIAPVFDVSRHVIIVDSQTVGDITRNPVPLTGEQPLEKVQELSELGVDNLVCGAVSRALQAALRARGIRVVAYVAGDVRDIIDAWRQQNFEAQVYAMPGGWRNRYGHLANDQQEEDVMPNKGSGGGRRMGGRGQGGKGYRRPASQPPNSADAATNGMCVCTQCGYSETHERGNPCVQKRCPQCGAGLSRK
jgi:predicted Fe-Mo cluster-binding NifX family protein